MMERSTSSERASSRAAATAILAGPRTFSLPTGSWRVFGAAQSVFRPPEAKKAAKDDNFCGGGTTYTLITPEMAWVEEVTSTDLTPCFDATGEWDPTDACTPFPTDIAQSIGDWGRGCGGALGGDPQCGELPEPPGTTMAPDDGGDSSSGGASSSSTSTTGPSPPPPTPTTEPEVGGTSGGETSGGAGDTNDGGCGCRHRGSSLRDRVLGPGLVVRGHRARKSPRPWCLTCRQRHERLQVAANTAAWNHESLNGGEGKTCTCPWASMKMLALGSTGFALGLTLGCGGSDDNAASGGSCVVNQQAFCACPGDPPTSPSGVQVCIAPDMFGPCMCDGAPTTDTDTDAETDDSESMEETTDEPDLCGNTIPDPGECDPDGNHNCPEDCIDGGSTTTTDDPSTSTGQDACAGMPIYVGNVPGIEPPWDFMGVTGFGAGRMMCQNMIDPTADVCTYENLVDAEANGDFAAVPASTTMWVHRNVVAMYMAQMVQPGNGARCDDWLYDTNHLYDGEYVTVEAGGALTFTLDTDVLTPAMGLLECAGQVRAIPCCVACP